MAKRNLANEHDVEMSEEEDALLEAMEEQAERDIAEYRVNMRWSKEQVDLIRRAAAIYGIPYQTYLKQAAVRQAMADLKAAGEVAKGS